MITNKNSENSNKMFSISEASLENFVNDTSVLSKTTGIMEWLIIPYYEASPEETTDYYIGGQFSYSIGGENITIELTPTKVSVVPDPRLSVHYFWEKYVWGDDPFTEHVTEPSKPFAVIAAIKNFGFGTAYDMSLSSGQPEIIENEKGLLVDFKLIGLTVDDGEIEPKFEADLGNLGPNSTSIVKWWMNCTLQGVFKNFSINIKNKNPNGDPKLSIIDSSEVHELFHQVKNKETDETLYLVRNRFTNETLAPDTIYHSKTLTTENVTIVQAEEVDIKVVDGFIQAIIKIETNVSGPVYLKANTEIEKKILPIKYFTKSSLSGSGIELPLVNSWFVNYNYKKDFLDVHIFDILPANSGSIVYIVRAGEEDTTTSTTLTTTTTTLTTTTTTLTTTTTTITTTILMSTTTLTTTTQLSTTTTSIATTTTTASSEKFKPDWKMKGKKLSTKRRIHSVDACWKICKQKNACNHISWFKKMKTCTLYATYTGGKRRSGYLSGPIIPIKTPAPGRQCNRCFNQNNIYLLRNNKL